ncbi:MAG: hypothetical protein Q8M94_02760, partial [Ignavibacteria bacterium]|nr:hypothetical protein [Ignavibacteria bacterium]
FYTMNRQDKREEKLEKNEVVLIAKGEKREEKLMLFLDATNNEHNKLMQSQNAVVDGLKEVANTQRETATCLSNIDGKLDAIIGYRLKEDDIARRRLKK